MAVAPIIAWVPSMVLALVALTAGLAVAAFVRASAPAGVHLAAGPQAAGAASAGPVAEGAEQQAASADPAAESASAPADVEAGSSQHRNGVDPPVLPAMLPSVLPALKTSPSQQQQQPQQQLLPGQLVTPACGTPRRDAAGSVSELHEHAPHGHSPAGDQTGSSSVGNSASSKLTGSTAGGVGRALVALPTGAESSAKETRAVTGGAQDVSSEPASTTRAVAGDYVLVKELRCARLCRHACLSYSQLRAARMDALHAGLALYLTRSLTPHLINHLSTQLARFDGGDAAATLLAAALARAALGDAFGERVRPRRGRRGAHCETPIGPLSLELSFLRMCIQGQLSPSIAVASCVWWLTSHWLANRHAPGPSLGRTRNPTLASPPAPCRCWASWAPAAAARPRC